MIPVNTYNTPTYACLLDGCHRMVLPCSPSLSLFCQLSVSSRFSSFPLFFLHDLLLTLRLLLPASSPFPLVEKEQINKTNKQHFLCTRVVMFSCFHRLEIIRLTCSPPFSQELSDMLLGGGGVFFFLD